MSPGQNQNGPENFAEYELQDDQTQKHGMIEEGHLRRLTCDCWFQGKHRGNEMPSPTASRGGIV